MSTWKGHSSLLLSSHWEELPIGPECKWPRIHELLCAEEERGPCCGWALRSAVFNKHLGHQCCAIYCASCWDYSGKSPCWRIYKLWGVGVQKGERGWTCRKISYNMTDAVIEVLLQCVTRVLLTSTWGKMMGKLKKVNEVDDIGAGTWINSIFSLQTYCSLIWNNSFAFVNVLLRLVLVLEASSLRSNILCLLGASNGLHLPKSTWYMSTVVSSKWVWIVWLRRSWPETSGCTWKVC